MAKQLQVTIVGAGRYGRELIAPKYANNSSCFIKAVIDPLVSGKLLAKGVLGSIPLCGSAAEWLDTHGRPDAGDLFELAVHYDALPGLLEELSRAGAKNFVLPKPVALDDKTLAYIKKLQKKFKLNYAISSQWHYSEVTRLVGKCIQDMKKGGECMRVKFNFSQFFSHEQLKHYSSRTALFPHILEIIYSTELSDFKKIKVQVKKISNSYLNCVIALGSVMTIEILSDLRAKEKARSMEAGSMKVDFLASFKDGAAVKYPSVVYRGKTTKIKEDNLQVMVDVIVSAFLRYANIAEDKKVLTLEKYNPIAEFQVFLESNLRPGNYVFNG